MVGKFNKISKKRQTIENIHEFGFDKFVGGILEFTALVCTAATTVGTLSVYGANPAVTNLIMEWMVPISAIGIALSNNTIGTKIVNKLLDPKKISRHRI